MDRRCKRRGDVKWYDHDGKTCFIKALQFLTCAIAFVGCSTLPSVGWSQLLVGPPNSSISIERLQEFMLFDGVTKSQLTAFHFTFQSDEMPVGVIVPVKPQDNVILGKSSVFEQISRITKPKVHKQRQLKISFSSYLWQMLTMETSASVHPVPPKTAALSASSTLMFDDHSDVVEWAIAEGLYVTMPLIKALRELNHSGHFFHVYLLNQTGMKKKVESATLKRTPTIFVRTSTARPRRLPMRFGTHRDIHHTFTLLSDSPYDLKMAAQDSHRITFRNHLKKRRLSKVISTIPKELHAYNRAAYLHSFQIESDEADTGQLYRMQTPDIVESDRVASYDPLRLTIPIEIMFAVVGLTIWLWNRDRFSIKSAKRERIRML